MGFWFLDKNISKSSRWRQKGEMACWMAHGRTKENENEHAWSKERYVRSRNESGHLESGENISYIRKTWLRGLEKVLMMIDDCWQTFKLKCKEMNQLTFEWWSHRTPRRIGTRRCWAVLARAPSRPAWVAQTATSMFRTETSLLKSRASRYQSSRRRSVRRRRRGSLAGRYARAENTGSRYQIESFTNGLKRDSHRHIWLATGVDSLRYRVH